MEEGGVGQGAEDVDHRVHGIAVVAVKFSLDGAEVRTRKGVAADNDGIDGVRFDGAQPGLAHGSSCQYCDASCATTTDDDLIGVDLPFVGMSHAIPQRRANILHGSITRTDDLGLIICRRGFKTRRAKKSETIRCRCSDKSLGCVAATQGIHIFRIAAKKTTTMHP